MDGDTFDALVKRLTETATSGSRRALLRLVTALPITGILATLPEAGEAAGRQRRRTRRHQHPSGDDQGHRKDDHDDAQADACIPTGQRCPSRKPRGKHHRKLSCAQCCQGVSHTEADGKSYCGCQPNGGACDPATAASCCSGFCNGAICQAAPCSAAIPCPQCKTCNASTGLCEAVADGSICNDGNACTTGETCTSGTCGGGSSICTTAPPCRTTLGATCSGGDCTYPPLAAGTPCSSVPCGECDGTGTCVSTSCGSGGSAICCGLGTTCCGTPSAPVCCNDATQTCLPNGTCATRCTSAAECQPACVVCSQAVNHLAYCRGASASTMCTSMAECDPGQFCRGDGECFVACTP